MFVGWFLGFIGFLSVGNIYCQGSAPTLASLDASDNDVSAGGTVNDNPVGELPKDIDNSPANEASVTGTSSPIPSTTTPEPFSCHECTNCNSKSDFISRVCEEGVTMCYKMHKLINNTSQIIRGCSTSKSKGQCTAPIDDQSKSFESITCCTSHKCNQAAHFKPLFFLSTLSLFIIS